MIDDRWKALCTHDGIPFPEPDWHDPHTWSGLGDCAENSPGVAAHIATWSPDVTAEIVAALREAYELLEGEGIGWDWRCRLDALLEHVGGKKP